MSKIVLNNINKYYGDNHVLKDVNLTIEDGAFMTLLGPSGCGKTTTLRVIAGLERPQQGSIFMDDRMVVNAKEQFFEPPAKRGLNLVFQSYALWPHMTVFENIAFGLRVNNTPKDQLHSLVNNALKRMQIAEFTKRYPSELSGGQQQRVAIARAIASAPKLLLLDEPLSNLDAKLRIDMRSELKRMHQEMGTTIIYVTHDQVEALTLSTDIAIFFDGSIEQVAPPMDVYQNPATTRVASFIGNPRINLIKGKAQVVKDSMRVNCALGSFEFPAYTFTKYTQQGAFDCQVGFRPEQVDILPSAHEGTIAANVYSSMPAGSETLLQLIKEDENFLVKRLGVKHYSQDELVYIKIKPELLNVYDTKSGQLIKLASVI